MNSIIKNSRVEIELWVLVTLIAFCAIQRVFEPKDTEWPSWVQAVGSVVAILASARIAQVNFRKADALHFAETERRQNEEEERRMEADADRVRIKQDEADRQKAEVQNTERLVLQLMVKADESVKRLNTAYRGSSEAFYPAAYTAKGAFDAIIVGLSSVDSRHFSSFDKFEQCINVLGACMALSAQTDTWIQKGLTNSADVVIPAQQIVISDSVTRFRQLTGLSPLERNHAATYASA